LTRIGLDQFNWFGACGQSGGTPGGSAYNSGFASASAGSEAKGPGDSADIIDVDVIAIKSQDEP